MTGIRVVIQAPVSRRENMMSKQELGVRGRGAEDKQAAAFKLDPRS